MSNNDLEQNNKKHTLAADQKNWIKKLIEIIPKNSVKDLKLAKVIGSDGKRDYRNLSDTTEIWKLADDRSILDNEIVCEFDGDNKKENYENCKKVVGFLDAEKISYIIGDHGGKSPHIHIFFSVEDEVLIGDITYQILREIIYEWICKKSGVPFEKDKPEINFSPLKYDEEGNLQGGHLIREFGGGYLKNSSVTYKTLMDFIPDPEKDNGITDPENVRFPDKIELWKVTAKQFENIRQTLWLKGEEEIEKIEITPEITRPLSQKELREILGLTIKRDDTNKEITFRCMLTAYTEESQCNVSFRSPSSLGKSYIPIELSALFPDPERDIVMIAYASPTAFFHDAGVWDEKRNALVINLERKILIFLDQPHDQLLQRMRPLLSHDKKELLLKITDRRERKGLRTKNVIIRGFCVVIFCTGSLKIDEQEATRNFILSPESTQEKIREGIYLKAERKANPSAFQEKLDQNLERQLLKKRIRAIQQEKIRHVVIKNPKEVADRFLEKRNMLKGKHMRDVERVFTLIQSFALLNLWHRERNNAGDVFANEEDIKNGFLLYEEIAESQEIGIPPYIFMIYKDVIRPLHIEINSDNAEPIGLTRKQISTRYWEVYSHPVADWFLRQEILSTLESVGLIIQESDPIDKRKKVVHLPHSSTHYSSRNSELGCGVGTLEEFYPDGIEHPIAKADKAMQAKKQYPWNPPAPNSPDEELNHWIYGVQNVIANLSDDEVIEMAVNAGWKVSKVSEILKHRKKQSQSNIKIQDYPSLERELITGHTDQSL